MNAVEIKNKVIGRRSRQTNKPEESKQKGRLLREKQH